MNFEKKYKENFNNTKKLRYRSISTFILFLLIISPNALFIIDPIIKERQISDQNSELNLSSSNLDVPYFSQLDDRWKYDRMIDKNGVDWGTVGAYGCAMTSTTMVLKYYSKDTDPGLFNAYLNSYAGYETGALLIWEKAIDYSDERIIDIEKLTFGDDQYQHWDKLKTELENGFPVIVKVDKYPSTYELDEHWVVVTGFIGGAVDEASNYYINDPADPSNTLLSVFYDETYDNTIFALRIYHGILEPNPVITSSLTLIPSDNYKVGDYVNGYFTIENKGTVPINFDVITIGGRDPDDLVADFTFIYGVSLNPGQSYPYSGSIILNKEGIYHFFCAYKNLDGSWNTAIPTETGKINVRDIIVSQTTPTPQEPVIISSLTILQSGPYYVGDTIIGQYTIKNKGSTSFTFEVLTIGGRDPNDQVADFTSHTWITLNPDQTHNYQGTLTLTKEGLYHFFCAYKTPQGVWNTAIPTEVGVTNVLDIIVNEQVSLPVPTITSNLLITPEIYHLGDTVQGEFTIKNKGSTPVILEILTIGGYDPDGVVAEFTDLNWITLNPDSPYEYHGSITLLKTGVYQFFCAYKTPDGHWNINIPTESGVVNSLNIVVTDVDVYPISVLDWEQNLYYTEQFRVVLEGVHGNILIPIDVFNSFDGTYYHFDNPIGDDSTPLLRSEDLLTSSDLNYMLNQFDNVIYPIETSAFGESAARGVEGKKVWILIHNIRDQFYYDPSSHAFVEGYFSAYGDIINNKNMIQLDTYDWENRIGPESSKPFQYESTFSHEFQHLIHFDHDNDEADWVNEGLANLAGFLCGYGHPTNQIIYYLYYHPITSLTNWQGYLENYGASYLFQLYLYEKYGQNAFTQALVSEETNGMEGIENALNSIDIFKSTSDIFADWAIANYLDLPELGSNYGYDSLDIGSADTNGITIEYVLSSIWGQAPKIAPFDISSDWFANIEPQPYTAHYLRFKNDNPAEVNFDGDDYAGIEKNAFSVTLISAKSVPDILYPTQKGVLLGFSPMQIDQITQSGTTNVIPTGVDEINVAIVYNSANHILSSHYDLDVHTFAAKIKLQKDGIEFSEINVREFFDICVGESSGNIIEVRFSCDDFQDGIATGQWVEYDWEISYSDWDAETKEKRWAFDTLGVKEVWVEIEDDLGRTDRSSCNVVCIPGYAIIVVGARAKWSPNPFGDEFNPILFDNIAIKYAAETTYKVLRNLGFDDDHIYYLDSRGSQDLDLDGDDDVDAPCTPQDIENTINEIRDKIVNCPSIPLLLYFVGHGLPEQFLCDPKLSEMELYSFQLSDLLDQFSIETPVLICMDSCYSESFITIGSPYDTQTISNANFPNRIIITSALDNELLLATSMLHYNYRFWNNLNNGLDLKQAFIHDANVLDFDHTRLDDNGDKIGSPPDNLGQDGLKAENMNYGIPGSNNFPIQPFEYIFLASPGELRIKDSQQRVTGLINGEVRMEIPNSIYDAENKIVIIFNAFDSYCYEIAGTDIGKYGLRIIHVEDGIVNDFLSKDIPINIEINHQYSIDWIDLSQGDEGVIIEVDIDGDNIPDYDFTSDNELNTAEFAIETLCWPYEDDALQDGVVFELESFDNTLINWITLSIREPGGEQGIVISDEFEGIQLYYDEENNLWKSSIFDTTQLPDGNYILFVQISDLSDFISTTTFDFSIRNWAIIELLPATPSNNPGRTMPVKFSLRVVEAVDPDMPFVVNEELCIVIYDMAKPNKILQTSYYGDSSKDYRIDYVGELYITNFRTSKTPATYVVEIWRGDMLLGDFTFITQKETNKPSIVTQNVMVGNLNAIILFSILSISLLGLIIIKTKRKKKRN